MKGTPSGGEKKAESFWIMKQNHWGAEETQKKNREEKEEGESRKGRTVVGTVRFREGKASTNEAAQKDPWGAME